MITSKPGENLLSGPPVTLSGTPQYFYRSKKPIIKYPRPNWPILKSEYEKFITNYVIQWATNKKGNLISRIQFGSEIIFGTITIFKRQTKYHYVINYLSRQAKPPLRSKRGNNDLKIICEISFELLKQILLNFLKTSEAEHLFSRRIIKNLRPKKYHDERTKQVASFVRKQYIKRIRGRV